MQLLEALRQRFPPSVSNQRGYRTLPTEAEAETELRPHYTPLYSNQKNVRRRHLDSRAGYGKAGNGTKVCFFFSLSGVIFLSWIGTMLARSSPYVRLEEESLSKPQLARSVYGAASLYFIFMCLAAFRWYHSLVDYRSPTLDTE
ncbi:unnamed protein product [Phaeothamnion confervicola]